MNKLFKASFKKEDEIVSAHGKGGSIKILERTISHQVFDGSWRSYTFPWTVLDRGNAVAILLHDPIHDEIILIEQFRPAVLKNLFEIPAGMIEGDEDQKTRVIQEVFQETEIMINSVDLIFSFLTSPGISSEKIFLYYAQVTSLGEVDKIFGLKNEGEYIKKHIISRKEAMFMLDRGEIEDAKTIIALQWLRNEMK